MFTDPADTALLIDWRGCGFPDAVDRDRSDAYAPADGSNVVIDGVREVPNDLSAAIMAMLGHDLRQPLQVIVGARDVLARRLRGSPDEVQLSIIEDATTRLARTLDDLVNTVRLQEQSSHYRHELVPLDPMLADLAAEFAGPAAGKRVELRILPTSAVVSSHPVLLAGILRNLIRNAIDYTPRGGRVLVACRRRGAATHIEVRDSGVGIPPGEMTKIFEAFHRADASRAEGLGLGLFIVKRAAQFLGHRLEIRSALGRGSCFAVVAKSRAAVSDW